MTGVLGCSALGSKEPRTSAGAPAPGPGDSLPILSQSFVTGGSGYLVRERKVLNLPSQQLPPEEWRPFSFPSLDSRRTMDLPVQNVKFSWLVSTLLPLVSMPGDAGNTPTYSWRDAETQEWLVCNQCPPGTFVKHHCSHRSPTNCQPCPSLHYTQYWNYLEKCRYCNVFCGEHEEEAQACNVTHNRACRCQLGYYAHADFCIEHSACPPGSGVVTLGTPTQNTQCQPCPKGTFSDNSSSTERCQPHRNCTAFGMFLNVPGTSFHDTMCTRCASFLSSTPEPGNKECEKAVIDFVAFQNISLKRLRKLQQALETPDSWQREWPEPENRAAVQKELLHRLTELSDPQESSIFVLKLLQALRKAKLTTLEKNLRKRFLLALKD